MRGFPRACSAPSPAAVQRSATRWSTTCALAAVSFTGSTPVGLELQRRLAGRGVRVQTEMGGKNAAVVLADADLDLAASVIIAGAFGQAGQRCTATSRLIVDRAIAAELTRAGRGGGASAAGRSGRSRAIDLGPVVSRAAQRDIRGRVDRGVAEGGEVLARADVDAALLRGGSFVEPVLLTIDREQLALARRGFRAGARDARVDGLDEAIDAVNDSAYGLSSAIFTRSLDSAYRFIDEVDTGQVSVNQPTSGWDIHQPFGGFRNRGRRSRSRAWRRCASTRA